MVNIPPILAPAFKSGAVGRWLACPCCACVGHAKCETRPPSRVSRVCPAGEETARVLKEALEKYGLKNDVLERLMKAFTSDTAGNMVTLGEVMDFLDRFSCLCHAIMNAIKFAFACLVPEDWATVVEEVRWVIHMLLEPGVVKAVVTAPDNTRGCKVIGLYWQRFRGEPVFE